MGVNFGSFAGLSQREAAELLDKFGFNELKDSRNLVPLRLIFGQFGSPLVFILFVAAAIAAGSGQRFDSYLILAIIFLNAGLGFWQEFKAERALSALKKITIAQTRVIRDGVEVDIPNRELVPGDLIVVSSGQTVPADAKLLPAFSLEVNESALTGESLPVIKSGGDEESSLIFMGTTVTSGQARAVVTETGMRFKLFFLGFANANFPKTTI